MKNGASLAKYTHTSDILQDMREIIEVSRDNAYRAVNLALVRRNWLLGRRIAEEELKGDSRAEYGLEIIKKLAKELTKEYGKGFDRTNLYHYLKFYKYFPKIVDTACQLSQEVLSWSHYRILLRVENNEARHWYEKEAYRQTWAVRTLKRNVETQYYHRLLMSQHKELLETEMLQKTASYQNDKLEHIMNPVIAEFLGLSTTADVTETQLEAAILSNLQKFLMELGKGYAFVARQQHIHTEKE